MFSVGSSSPTQAHSTVRHKQTQKLICGIQNAKVKVHRELDQISKDIQDSVLEHHRAPGPLNPQTINFALSQKLWNLEKKESKLT